MALMGAGCSEAPRRSDSSNQITSEAVTTIQPTPTTPTVTPSAQEINFAAIDATYQFTGTVPANFAAEHIASLDAINIYDPSAKGANNLEKSQIFLRNFSANSFLTLNTVDILSREQTTIHNRPAVRYEIQKKSTIPNFSSQPLWRSGRHKLIDIRHTDSNPSVFYVIAANPSLSEPVFQSFIDSLKF